MLDELLKDGLLHQKRSIHHIRQNRQDWVWQKPDNFISLSSSDVDIWCVKLHSLSAHVQDLAGILSSEEKNRFEKFRFDRDKLRSVASRGMLRLILSAYLEQPPAQIEVISGPQGKPALFHQGKRHSIQFNVSHSHETVLYGITRIGEIGVDIEKVRDVPDFEKIIGRFFSPRERAAFDVLPPTQRKRAFFTCWSRKEAFMKARSDGFSLPLDQFDVSILPDQPAALLSTSWDPLEVDGWLLSDIRLDADHAAAMALDISSPGRYDDV
jgi:4'-phosphopantetheinyl transferase